MAHCMFQLHEIPSEKLVQKNPPYIFDTDTFLQLKTAIGDFKLETLFFDLSYADVRTDAQLCFFTTACGHCVTLSLFFLDSTEIILNPGVAQHTAERIFHRKI